MKTQPVQTFKKDDKKSKDKKKSESKKYERKRAHKDDSSDEEEDFYYDEEDDDEDDEDTQYETVSDSEEEETASSGSVCSDEDDDDDEDDNDNEDEVQEKDKKKKTGKKGLEKKESKSPSKHNQKGKYNTRSKKKVSNLSDEEENQEDGEDEEDGEEEGEQTLDENDKKKLINILKQKAMEIAEREEKRIAKKKKAQEKSQKKKPAKKQASKKSQKKQKEEEDDDDESEEYDDDEDDDEDDEDYDDEEEDETEISGPGFILSFDGFGAINNDEADYKQMIKEDKNEKCDSDDEEMFMKESYKKTNIPESPATKKNKTKKEGKKGKKDKKEKEDKEKEDNIVTEAKKVEEQYAELVKVRQDLMEQLEKTPNNKILRNAIKECRKSIAELVKKERNKNTEEYYKLVHKEPQDKKNTNEMSYFKKKLSHKEQMRVMKDLKEINGFTNTDKPYRLALLESDIPPKYKAIALQKLNVLKMMEPSDSEYYKMKNWVDGFMRVPYGIYKNLSVSLADGKEKCNDFLKTAKTTLDTCTYGLNDAKMQILQMVGQWISNPNAMGTAIAIKGPPGTGKTTLVKEGISKILGREFAFIALGGTSDASFMEGHSYTYEGSTWGKIVSILMECKCMNPVIYFDELDKISDTPKGEEITGILTHLTDTTQNNVFHDKYFSEVSFDLSKCLFIFSYNDESKVNPILKDRMYRIQTKGYDAKEKIIIARKHLLPKIREQVNFEESMVNIPDSTLEYIISHPSFCKEEQGVRNLKRCLEIIHTKLNLFRLVNSDEKMFEKDINLEVQFPFTVEKKHVDALIKADDPLNQSMLAMYV